MRYTGIDDNDNDKMIIHLSSSASSVTFGTAKMLAIKAILLVDSKIARARIKDFEKITL